MDKKDSPYKVYIEMYCKKCEWFSLKTDDLSTEQYKTMKKCIDKCAIVRMAINKNDYIGNITIDNKSNYHAKKL
jgi:predicted Rdx family selenoprotein